MSKGAHIFTLFVFYREKIKCQNTLQLGYMKLGQTLTRIFGDLLKQYGLTKNILAYAKNKGANLNTMIVALKLIVSCEALGVMESF
jgi:hypothetical protein